MNGEKLFRRPKKKILERDHRLSSMVFLEMDLGYVDLREA